MYNIHMHNNVHWVHTNILRMVTVPCRLLGGDTYVYRGTCELVGLLLSITTVHACIMHRCIIISLIIKDLMRGKANMSWSSEKDAVPCI